MRLESKLAESAIMSAEIISIGDELTSGQRLDTNSQWLSERLGELGIRVMFHTTVADDLAANVRVFREAFDRADLVIASGGLGPTADDLTREAIAEAAGVDLVQDEASLAHIRAIFARRGREMPERNIVQALFPRGSQVVHNPNGTAPGIDLVVPRAGRTPTRVIALPGVPAELFEMWRASVEPALAAAAGQGRKFIRHRRFKCFGVGESDLEQMLPDLIRRGRAPQVGITVSKATITLRITAEGPSPEECLVGMESTIATIHECLGNLVFGEEDDELEHSVVRLLGERNKTLATCEIGTGGMLAHWLSKADESGRCFLGGRVMRGPVPNASDKETSSAVAEMAKMCRRDCGADFGLAVGPFPPENQSPAGHFHYALATNDAVQVKSSPHTGHPEILKPRAGKQALNLLRLALSEAT